MVAVGWSILVGNILLIALLVQGSLSLMSNISAGVVKSK